LYRIAVDRNLLLVLRVILYNCMTLNFVCKTRGLGQCQNPVVFIRIEIHPMLPKPKPRVDIQRGVNKHSILYLPLVVKRKNNFPGVTTNSSIMFSNIFCPLSPGAKLREVQGSFQNTNIGLYSNRKQLISEDMIGVLVSTHLY
jgi:hypothetical protein